MKAEEENRLPSNNVIPYTLNKSDKTLFIELPDIDSFDRIIVTKSGTKWCKVFYSD